MKYFVDTNIFLRTLIRENKETFSECYRFLELIKTNKIEGVTSSLVLAEMIWTLTSYYRFSRKRAARAVRSVLSLSGLRIIDDYYHNLALTLFENNKVKYIDSLIASIPAVQDNAWVVVSYDKDFDRLGVLRREPGDVA